MLYENVYIFCRTDWEYVYKIFNKSNFVFSQKKKISYKPYVSHRKEEEEMIQKLVNGEKRKRGIDNWASKKR